MQRAGDGGGTEFGFLSCTTNLNVAIAYIDDRKAAPVIFQLEVGAIDKGAVLSWVSQYPGEDEVTMSAMSYIEVKDEPRPIQTKNGVIQLIPCRINCNHGCKTIDDIQNMRKSEIISIRHFRQQEFQRDFERVKHLLLSWIYLSRHEAIEICEQEFKLSLVRFEQVTKECQSQSTSYYNDDDSYLHELRRAVEFTKDQVQHLFRQLQGVGVNFRNNAIGVGSAHYFDWRVAQEQSMRQNTAYNREDSLLNLAVKEGLEHVVRLLIKDYSVDVMACDKVPCCLLLKKVCFYQKKSIILTQ